jgi:hypothetical protein
MKNSHFIKVIQIRMPKEFIAMSQSKRREENEWKIRKETQNPHGKIKSLEEYSDDYKAESSNK